MEHRTNPLGMHKLQVMTAKIIVLLPATEKKRLKLRGKNGSIGNNFGTEDALQI